KLPATFDKLHDRAMTEQGLLRRRQGGIRASGGWLELRLHALIEAGDIDDDALVTAVADRLLLVARGHLEREPAPLDGDELGARPDAHAHRRRGEMADVEMDAEA